MIFCTIQQCFVLNTSIKSILNKFIIQVAPPSDKINNSVFHLQNQARPLHSNAHIFKIPTPICTRFGTIQYHHILNISIKFNFISYLTKSDVTRWDNNLLFHHYKQKNNFRKLSCFLASLNPSVFKWPHKHHCINIDVLFIDISVILLLENAFETMSQILLMLHACKTFCHGQLQIKLPTKHNGCCYSSRWSAASAFPSFSTCCSRFCSAICPN